MDRTAYKNQHIKEHYDRINMLSLTVCINGNLHLKQEQKNDIV